MSSPSNVDDREIDAFDRIGRLWWDADGKMGMLHAINPLRLRFVSDHVNLQRARLVDIGCGGGIFAEALARAGADVVGIDRSRSSLAIAHQHATEAGLAIHYRMQTAEQLAVQRADRFDVVTCMEMLEHVPDPAAVVSACARLLRPGGHVFFSTINRTFKAWLFAIVGGEYVLRILPRGTHHYGKLVQPAELCAWATNSGLQYRAVASLVYNPFNRRFQVAPGQKDVNYMACFFRPKQ